MRPPKALLFDVNGTLYPADAAAAAFRELGLPSSGVQRWFDAVLRDGFAAQLAGAYVSFRQLATHHLGCLLAAHPGAAPGATAEEAADRVLAAWAAADLFPDVAPALRALHAGGVTLAVLTNGSADGIARRVLQKAGVEGAFTALLDIGMVAEEASGGGGGGGGWKPSAASYAFAARRLGLSPGEVMLIASHPWDCFGALQAGMQACYVQRDSESYPSFLPKQPQMVIPTFESLVRAMLGPQQ